MNRAICALLLSLPALGWAKVKVSPLDPSPPGSVAQVGAIVVDAPMDVVWSVVTECGRLRHFMPRIVESATRGPDRCYTKAEMPFPFSDLWAVTQHRDKTLATGGKLRQFRLVRGTYSDLRGSWRLYPLPGGAIRVTHRLRSTPDTGVPDSLIESNAEDAVRDVMEAVRREIRARNRPSLARR